MTFKCGVELELLGNSYTMADVLRDTGTTDYNIRGDGSIRGEGAEIVSPILTTKKHLKKLYKMVVKLKEKGMKVNDSCGFHVHIDASTLSKTDLLSIYNKYKKYEKVIDQVLHKSRHNNTYCKSLPNINASHLVTNRYANNRIEYNGGRYVKLNLAALSRHGTIEFRHHHGTVNADEVINWVWFCINFVENHKLPGLFDGFPKNIVDYYSKYITEVKPADISKLEQKIKEVNQIPLVIDEAVVKQKAQRALDTQKRSIQSNIMSYKNDIEHNKRYIIEYNKRIASYEEAVEKLTTELNECDKPEKLDLLFNDYMKLEGKVLKDKQKREITAIKKKINMAVEEVKSKEELKKQLTTAEKLKKLISIED